jgi:hypothetical protein
LSKKISGPHLNHSNGWNGCGCSNGCVYNFDILGINMTTTTTTTTTTTRKVSYRVIYTIRLKWRTIMN